MRLLDFLKIKIRGSLNLKKLIKEGLVVGDNFNAMEGTIIDPGHCWLIEIGNNVTLAPRVHLLAHDTSMKKSLGYVKLGKVKIGNNVFIGANTTVLPNVIIDDNTIIGAGSVVSKSLLGGGVYCGNPCKKLFSYEEWLEKIKRKYDESPKFDSSYKIGNITPEKKEEMKNKIIEYGYIL